METKIINYLKKCEHLAQENKPIPKLELKTGIKYGSQKDMAQAISSLLGQDISESDIMVQATACSPLCYCNMSYGPIAPQMAELSIIHFYYQSEAGLFKAERFDDALYFYSPHYLNNPDIVSNNRFFKRTAIVGIGLVALLIIALVLLT